MRAHARCAKSAAVVLAAILLPASALAGDNSYIQRFDKTWKGGGSANLNLYLPSFPVNCTLSPTPQPNAIRLRGRCRLKLLFFLSQSIDTTLTHDVAKDTYTGVYSVDGGPNAILSGRADGDALNLDVTWPILINGHYKAKIYIINDGRGHFSLKTVDPLGLSGKPMTTSDLSFRPG
jgi:hypothetical protein